MLSLSRRYFLTFEHLAKCTRCLTGNRRYPGKSRWRDKSGGVEEVLVEIQRQVKQPFRVNDGCNISLESRLDKHLTELKRLPLVHLPCSCLDNHKYIMPTVWTSGILVSGKRTKVVIPRSYLHFLMTFTKYEDKAIFVPRCKVYSIFIWYILNNV